MKSFKRNNPLENLDNTPKKPETIRMEEQKEAVVSEDQKEENKEKKGKGEKKYLRLDITNYQDYVNLMAQYASKTSGKHVSMTQYILKLIEMDKNNNIDIYDRLAEIEQMKNKII